MSDNKKSFDGSTATHNKNLSVGGQSLCPPCAQIASRICREYRDELLQRAADETNSAKAEVLLAMACCAAACAERIAKGGAR